MPLAKDGVHMGRREKPTQPGEATGMASETGWDETTVHAVDRGSPERDAC
jgi:hypothetical protein